MKTIGKRQLIKKNATGKADSADKSFRYASQQGEAAHTDAGSGSFIVAQTSTAQPISTTNTTPSSGGQAIRSFTVDAATFVTVESPSVTTNASSSASSSTTSGLDSTADLLSAVGSQSFSTSAGATITPRTEVASLEPDAGTETVARSAASSTLDSASDGNGPALMAAAVPNKIVLENQKQGNPKSEWGINGDGDPTIQGFATQISSNTGDTVDFKIATDSTNYRIDIYRMGYYGGDGARKVATIDKEMTTAQIQPHPLVDYTTGLIDCANWEVSASWQIPQDATSGIYFARLVREDGGGSNGGASIIPFIVREDGSTSDIVFQTSDTTWQAYNAWGGASLYEGDLPVDPNKMIGWVPPNCNCSVNAIGKAVAVSYNRPFVTQTSAMGGTWDFVFGPEMAAVNWLEQNGYDVSYISGVDTTRNGTQLLNHDAFLSVGHDEYWSSEQRTNVENARDSGVNLAFWSGNEIYWKVRWDEDADGNAYRTMISYKETWGIKEDPSGISTGTWRDYRYADPGQEPENSLTGTMFTVDSYRVDTITIPYDMSNFRFWRDTAVADLQPGQTHSLVQNLLGYEWDSDVDNGYRPAGLINMSLSTVDVNTYLRDWGSYVTSKDAVPHSLTMYRAESGALVFGAGTVFWSWGLSSNHAGTPTPTDPAVQQAMVNMFADMGIQPQTLQASLVLATQSTDNVKPTSTINSPIIGASFVEGQKVTITGTASDAGGGMVAAVEVSYDGGNSWWRAAGRENWTYTWAVQAAGNYTIMSRAVDDSLNLETPATGYSVTVEVPDTSSLFSFTTKPQEEAVNDRDSVELGVRFRSSTAGTVEGIRFYKGILNTSPHPVSLWTADGQLLARGMSTGESIRGWQEVVFDTPVAISANTVYVASYHADGFYSSTTQFFGEGYSNGPLSVVEGGGVYGYGTSPVFPTGTYHNENYWVDVVFQPSNANLAPTAGNDGGFTTLQGQSLTLAFSALLANDTDPNGDALSITGVSGATNGTVAINSQTGMITFTPTAGYTGAASFKYTISDGRGGTSEATVNLSVTTAPTGISLFGPGQGPTGNPYDDGTGVELGMRFLSATAGTVSGMKFYKAVGETGTHVGSIWKADGTLLGTVTFGNESASGWQTASFAAPIDIVAGQQYIVSYYSNGKYYGTGGYFSSSITNGPLTAPASQSGSANGLYAYGNSSRFPTQTYQSANYWVDVIFNEPGGPVNIAPVAVNDSGYSTTQNTALSLAAALLLSNDSDADGDTLNLTGVDQAVNGTVAFNGTTGMVTFTPTAGYTGAASFQYTVSDGKGGTSRATVSLNVTAQPNSAPVAVGDTGYSTNRNAALSLSAATLLANDTDSDGDTLSITGVSQAVNGTVSYNSTTRTVTFTPATGYTGSAGFSYTISDGRGGTSSATVSLNVVTPPNSAPVAVNDSGYTVVEGNVLSLGASTLLANDNDVDGDPLNITGVDQAVNGTVSYNADTSTVSFTPTSGYTGSASFRYTVSDGNGGTASATVSFSVTPDNSNAISLFPNGTPAQPSTNDPSGVELGMRFTVSQAGAITGIRYYKSAADTGTHTGSLWTSGGTLLTTGTFTNETASGWQTLNFTQPISVAAGTSLVVSYHSNGNYAITPGYFTSSVTNGPLTAAGSNNGVFAYGNTSLFPTSSWNASNYWVDVLYQPAAPAPNVAPVAVDDTGFTTGFNTAKVIQANQLLANDTDANSDILTVTGVSNAVNGSVAFNSTTGAVTFTPTADYTGTASFAYSISDGKGGTASATVSLTVNSGAPQAPTQSLFSAADVPTIVNENDPNPVQLGMKFQTDVDGWITGFSFYKGSQNTGTHTANLWTSTGTLLGTATFTNETASGWQYVDLSQEVAIAADTTYIVSYNATNSYSATPNYFSTERESQNLTALSSAVSGGNGVYAYGSGTLFPTSTYQNTNYYVDVAFRPQLAA
ncbi:MAG: DUF4082 domain-containing protein [Rhizobiaceae bacterium]|nr:DUF4082 domain-containing protein [Rhizobiaceae bacterium]